jgi:hypothetical protein
VVSSSRNHHLGPAHQRQRDEQPLALAAGQVGEGGVALGGQPPLLQQQTPVGRAPVEGGVQVQRLPDLQPVGQRRLLELDADALAQLGALAARIQAEHPHRTRIGAAEPLQALHRGGLARPVGPDDPKDLAGLHGERDAVHRHRRAVPLAQLGDLDDRRHRPLLVLVGNASSPAGSAWRDVVPETSPDLVMFVALDRPRVAAC